MNLNDLLKGNGIEPKRVLVLRHRPHEPELRKVLPWLAAEKPAVFNAYQQAQGEKLERAMEAMNGTGYLASFIGRGAGRALFVGLYSIAGSRPQTYDQFWRVLENVELKALGMNGRTNKARIGLWFDLVLTDFYIHWKGKLVVGWPPPKRPMGAITFLVGGYVMRIADMVATAYFASVILRILDLPFCSEFRRIWKLATSSGSKLPGRNGCTHALQTA